MLIIIILAFLAVSSATATPPRFRLIDLGEASKSDESAALAVNAAGRVLVHDISRTGSRTLIWNADPADPELGAVTEINLPNTRAFSPSGLNDYGQILFFRTTRSPIEGGLVLWTPDKLSGTVGTLAPLQPPLAGARVDTEAFLSNRGEVYGAYFDEKQPGWWVSLKWMVDQPHQVPSRTVLLKDSQSGQQIWRPADANDAGWVITDSWTDVDTPNLWCPTPDDPTKGFCHRVVPNDQFAGNSRRLIAINNRNQILGGLGEPNPFVLDVDKDFRPRQHQIIQRPPTLRGRLEPKAINDRGIVVGLLDGAQTSFLWEADIGVHELGSLVDNLPPNWHLLANAINEKGWICGMAYVGLLPKPRGSPSPRRRAFVLIPVEHE